MKRYNPKTVESKWQQIWKDTDLYSTDLEAASSFYQLTMFPYPSGDLHTGHWYAFTGADVMARYQRMQGKQVLFPMGWDAFGLPAENAAIKRSIPPAEWTRSNIASMRQQIERMGARFDWSRELSTASPDYYKWTQWLFILLYENGLAYREKGQQNWCPSCQTVLANEQVVGEENICERCDSPVEKKEMEQWFFRITDYADELLDGLDEVEWPERIKTMQRNWIGKSEGANVKFPIVESDQSIDVYTTRPDTLFGATFMVLAPEHPLVRHVTSEDARSEVEQYVEEAGRKSDVERMEGGKDKTGVPTGGYAINPMSQTHIPIWVADYVLMGYGSGAIMAVPAHDDRDYEFARQHGLEIKQVVEAEELPSADYGELMNSGRFDGLYSDIAKSEIVKDLQKQQLATPATQYKLRDWLISRQRYWGAPIPIVYCESCGTVPVPEGDLPVELPENVEFEPTGKSPLQTREDFVHTECPECGGAAHREVDTMDTFVDSSWYFLRFPSVDNQGQAFDADKTKRWLPVDHYTGGIEHAILHLLYARFITKVLRDYAGLDFSEPFQKLTSQGLILGPDGNKMSKSRGNIVNPDHVIDSGYGADAFRMYLLFIGPWTEGGPFDVDGITGVYRFLNRVWQLLQDYQAESQPSHHAQASELEVRMRRLQHQTVKKVSDDIETGVHFNTAIAALMEYVNELYKVHHDLPADKSNSVWSEAIGVLLQLIAPFSPHISEELWNQLGNHDSIHIQDWPKYDKSLLVTDTVTIPVQVNGKVRDRLLINANASEAELEDLAKESDKVANEIADKELVKTIVVPGKLVNFVVK